MKILLSIVFLLALSASAQQRGNGDKVDSFPSLSERQLLVLTNACRLAPAQYRDLYIGNFQVLLPSNYPAVRPLYWSLGLNKSAHAHCIDMANNCGMQHPSCDGTIWSARIQSFYNNKNSSIGENIATGNQTALATIKQWVLEVSNPTPTTVPPDKDAGGADGHRKNIMTATYKELGCGYAYNSGRQWYHFWTQDFAGGKPDFNNPLVAGCHFFIETGKTTFFVNYYDSSGIVPTEVSCTIDGQKSAMALAMGTTAKGTYSLVQTKGTLCRQYFFSCLRNGTTCRYPEYGMLQTSGEGPCSQDYIAPENVSVVASPRIGCKDPAFRIWSTGGSKYRLSILSPFDYPALVSISDLQGRVVFFQTMLSETSNTSMFLPFICRTNVYIASVKTQRGKMSSSSIFTAK